MENQDLENSYQRRAILLTTMDGQKDRNIHCGECTGRCCTSFANSMQCTPLEAQEISLWLAENFKDLSKVVRALNSSVKDYRLDYEIPTTRGQSFRRTYTCPFFNFGPLGCSLPPKIKPYGCLGFNPTKPHVKDGEGCQSFSELLEKRDEEWIEKENEVNQTLKQKYGLYWDKKPLPMAVLEMLDVMGRLDRESTKD